MTMTGRHISRLLTDRFIRHGEVDQLAPGSAVLVHYFTLLVLTRGTGLAAYVVRESFVQIHIGSQ
jgi:hypothetical protein